MTVFQKLGPVDMSQGVYYCLGSVVGSSSGNDIWVDMVVATNMNLAHIAPEILGFLGLGFGPREETMEGKLKGL